MPLPSGLATTQPEAHALRQQIGDKLATELIDDAVDCRRGNGEHAATRSENSHADEASLRIDEGAAFSGRAEHQIHTDEVVDGAAADTVPRPSHGGDDAEASDRRTFVISDCQDDIRIPRSHLDRWRTTWREGAEEQRVVVRKGVVPPEAAHHRSAGALGKRVQLLGGLAPVDARAHHEQWVSRRVEEIECGGDIVGVGHRARDGRGRWELRGRVAVEDVGADGQRHRSGPVLLQILDDDAALGDGAAAAIVAEDRHLAGGPACQQICA